VSKRWLRSGITDYCPSIEESILEDIALLRASPLIKKSTQIIGLAYDIHTGVLTEVPEQKKEFFLGGI
jgi:carbonic anhydrase